MENDNKKTDKQCECFPDKNLYCMAMHYKCLYEQAINGKEADITEPCRFCVLFDECKGNYKPMHEYCAEITKLPIRMLLLQQKKESDNCCPKDN